MLVFELTHGQRDLAEVIPLIGGKRWVSPSGEVRFYFNDLADLVGLNLTFYGTGNISGAALNGERISNSKAKRLLSSLTGAKVWYSGGKVYCKDMPDWAIEPLQAALQEKVRRCLGDL